MGHPVDEEKLLGRSVEFQSGRGVVVRVCSPVPRFGFRLGAVSDAIRVSGCFYCPAVTAKTPGKPPKTRVRSGERGRNRTFNLLIKSQLLCQLSYAPAMPLKILANRIA
jgi:hypothetical protein